MSAKRSAAYDDINPSLADFLSSSNTMFEALSQPSAKAAKVDMNTSLAGAASQHDRGQYAVDQVMQANYAMLPISTGGIMAPSFIGQADAQQQLSELTQQQQLQQQQLQQLSSQTVNQAQAMLDTPASLAQNSLASDMELFDGIPDDAFSSLASDFPADMTSTSQPPLSIPDTSLQSASLQSLVSVANSAAPPMPAATISSAQSSTHPVPTADGQNLEARVKQYIATHPDQRGDMRLILLHPRVVQKSYGSEKRFFCPPPAIILRGAGWFNNPTLGDITLYVNMHMDPEKGEHTKIALTPSGADESTGVARTLYIQDSDKRKSFCLHLKTFFIKDKEGRDVGTFASKPLRVISKPSKKKQSVKTNPDLCMEDGCEIVLFNRMRTAAATTRYLCFDANGELSHETEGWNSFKMTLIHENQNGQNMQHSIRRQRFINYNNRVLLTCLQTNTSMECRIVKLEKGVTDVTSNDPISQLQKIALVRADVPGQFVTFKDNAVSFMEANTRGKSAAADKPKLAEAAHWTICTCARSEYCFSDPRILNGLPGDPVTPVPLVDMVKTLGKFVELYGEHFSTMLTVYFNDVPAETFYRCEELLFCTPPDFKLIAPESNGICDQPREVELTLVREDGVIYHTGQTYKYDVDNMMMLQLFANANPNNSHQLPGAGPPAVSQ
eukprot:TRINITY_DN9087_c0_g1_i5.p1 TRINITY_DN9087_c0_g1~~TRINITY_DN9087_c0_g1_i5.p1  ORF type:complete len:669 (+),score=194.09 TRINITY_DN9087_c0_g1_i5:160-2166(+)